MTIERRKFAVILLGAAIPVVVAAAPPETRLAPQVDAVQRCRALTDPAARLACYDQSVDVLARATASKEVVVIDRTEVRSARRGLFGFAMPRIGFLSPRPGNAEDRTDEAKLDTTITAARDIGYGKFRFTLADGAVWETVEASSNFNDPHPGATVSIEKGSLGSYFVQVDGRGRRVQAKRVG